MASGTRKENAKKQDKYVEARIKGMSKQAAAKEAGYAPTTKESQIEKPGSPAHTKILAALDKRGLDEEYLAESYKTAIEESKTERGRSGDYNAHAKLLLQLGYLRGLGKKDGPGVAIQINNGPKGEPLEPGRLEDALREIESRRGLVEKALGDEQLPRVHARDSGPIDAVAYSDVVGDAGEPSEDGSGGQP